MVSLRFIEFLLVEVISIEILSQKLDELWVGLEGRLLIIIRSPSAALKTWLNECAGINCRLFKSRICCW